MCLLQLHVVACNTSQPTSIYSHDGRHNINRIHVDRCMESDNMINDFCVYAIMHIFKHMYLEPVETVNIIIIS